MAQSKSVIKAVEKFNREHTTVTQVRLNHNTDADILAKLAKISESKMGYIKRLIREDIQKNGY